ncbi:hypothetical protein THAOC_09614 [Thalassiosira oceanica]|uniref:Uncharacterized protein n=1 Tax=Thalassiosira oceanica TaxID=159749 RepID=K0SS80_THAOC|nr:hypothetical protein THAOC_09614 [Thalassiosira oceanica]|eukprot:EJK69158.1 hypothetical protein THAOC_09614 [Thalassiosira oceanica]
MQGHAQSRNNLGCIEGRKGNYDRAVKHFLISARMGHKGSVGAVKMVFTNGYATKEQYADALKGYPDAVEERKAMIGMKPRGLDTRNIAAQIV